MEYNSEYINIKYALISAFLFKADSNILDISYNVQSDTLTIQVVLLEGAILSETLKEKAKINLPELDIVINVIHLTKEEFNENKGEWLPKHYQWLNYLLFSKAEAL
jgi:predicted amino acid-binding ACT domain protein